MVNKYEYYIKFHWLLLMLKVKVKPVSRNDWNFWFGNSQICESAMWRNHCSHCYKSCMFMTIVIVKDEWWTRCRRYHHKFYSEHLSTASTAHYTCCSGCIELPYDSVDRATRRPGSRCNPADNRKCCWILRWTNVAAYRRYRHNVLQE